MEHDAQAIWASDHVVELGPASGERGGEVVFEGTAEELELQDTVTGRYISGRSPIVRAESLGQLMAPRAKAQGSDAAQP